MYKYFTVEGARLTALRQANGSTAFINVPTATIVRVRDAEINGFNNTGYFHCEVMQRDKINKIVWEETWLNPQHIYNISPTEDPEAPPPAKVITPDEVA